MTSVRPSIKPDLLFSIKSKNKLCDIAATATLAFPPYYFKQQEVVEQTKTYWGKGPETEQRCLERLHARTGVEGRYFSRPLDDYEALDTWGKDQQCLD